MATPPDDYNLGPATLTFTFNDIDTTNLRLMAGRELVDVAFPPINRDLEAEVQRLVSTRIAQDVDDVLINGLRSAEAGRALRGRLNSLVMVDDAGIERGLNSVLGLEEEQEEVIEPKPKFRHIRL